MITRDDDLKENQICMFSAFCEQNKKKKKGGIYTAAGMGIRIYKCYLHGSLQETKRLYTRLPGVSIELLFTRQPFKSPIG